MIDAFESDKFSWERLLWLRKKQLEMIKELNKARITIKNARERKREIENIQGEMTKISNEITTLLKLLTCADCKFVQSIFWRKRKKVYIISCKEYNGGRKMEIPDISIKWCSLAQPKPEDSVHAFARMDKRASDEAMR